MLNIGKTLRIHVFTHNLSELLLRSARSNRSGYEMLRFETFAICIALILASVGSSNAKIRFNVLDPGLVTRPSGAESLRGHNTVIYYAGIKDNCNDR